MKVVFLCGGIGKRMAPISEDKFLLKFLGKTLLEHQIDLAKEAGLKKFVFICNPKNANKIKEIARRKRLDAEFAIQQEAQGMADALLAAKRYLYGEILVVSPHDIFDLSAYKNLLKERAKDKRKPATTYIVGYVVEKYFPGGYLIVNRKDEMLGIIEKPGEGKEPSRLVNIVIHLHTKPEELIKLLQTTKSDKDDVYEKSLDRMIKEKKMRFKVVRYNGFWTAIKYPWHIFNVTRYFLDKEKRQIARSAKISKSAVIEGDVVIGAGTKILEGAMIRGPCYIGENCVIGNNALVRDYSHIGNGSVIGYSSEIKNSYIGENCWFHTNYIGDSIIMDKCNFGSGAVTANWRFDEGNVKVTVRDQRMDSGTNKLGAIVGENCKFGINASIMPGVKVGPNSLVGPGVLLSRDLGPDMAVTVEQEHNIVERRKT